VKYLIIGNSAAAIGAVEGIRSVDGNGEITVVSKENHHSYSKPLISYYLAGKVNAGQMYFREADFYKQNRVDCYFGEEATSLSNISRHVHVEPSGYDLPYDRLLIATGGKPVFPPSFSATYHNVFNFHQLNDVERINRYAAVPMRAIVVGGGLIGLKAAESLYNRGHAVTIVEAAPHLLNSMLEANSAAIVYEHVQMHGIKIILANTVEAVLGKDKAEALILKDGSIEECDLVVVAAGTRPSADWLASSGIQLNKGIVVDVNLQTSLPDVYAAGDVVEVYDPMTQTCLHTPLWPHAYRQGKIAGVNMAGKKDVYPVEPPFNSLPLLGLNIAAAGVGWATEKDLEIIERRSSRAQYNRFVWRDNTLLGFIMVGDISRCGIYRQLIGKDIAAVIDKKAVGAPGFGMIDLPYEYRNVANARMH